MKNARYVVPDEAPVWVKNLLTGSPSRQSVRLLISLSIITAAVVALVERGMFAALVSLVFLGYAVLAWLALRWADRNGIFKKQKAEPGEPADPAQRL